jgi:hypothetical protein
MIAMKNFQSKSAEKFSIRVWLQKVKHMYLNIRNLFTTESGTGARYFNQSLPGNFQSRSAEKFSSRVWLKNFNQGLIDL